MISFRMLKQARTAFSMLNPETVRRKVKRPIHVGLVASSSAAYAEMEDFLLPASVSHDDRMRLIENIHRAEDPGNPESIDLTLYEPGLPCPDDAYTFYRDDPEQTVEDILDEHEDLALALAYNFPAFRRPVVEQTIDTIARENAMFAIATGLPRIVALFTMPLAAGEFASDTAFLTMNQVRMTFMLAAACGRPVGLAEQKLELASVIGTAFGWRAVARELAGKIPFGRGLPAKGAIAYAGTLAVGKALQRLYLGADHIRVEQALDYQRAGRPALEPGPA